MNDNNDYDDGVIFPTYLTTKTNFHLHKITTTTNNNILYEKSAKTHKVGLKLMDALILKQPLVKRANMQKKKQGPNFYLKYYTVY